MLCGRKEIFRYDWSLLRCLGSRLPCKRQSICSSSYTLLCVVGCAVRRLRWNSIVLQIYRNLARGQRISSISFVKQKGVNSFASIVGHAPKTVWHGPESKRSITMMTERHVIVSANSDHSTKQPKHSAHTWKSLSLVSTESENRLRRFSIRQLIIALSLELYTNEQSEIYSVRRRWKWCFWNLVHVADDKQYTCSRPGYRWTLTHTIHWFWIIFLFPFPASKCLCILLFAAKRTAHINTPSV